MPPNPDSLAGSSSGASILLVEEYDALAIAIGSALRKFAPRHLRRVATSLPEAQALAETIQPELLIIDLDPPQAGLVPFLEGLKIVQPTLRVLAIGCGTSAKFAAERAGEGAIQFLEKPFELSDFGAAVQALLPATDPAAELRGMLADLDLADLIALQCVNAGKSVLQVHASGGRTGELHFQDGQLCHAIAPGLADERALEEMLRWRAPHFSEMDRPPGAPRTMNGPWDAIIITALSHTRSRAEPARARAPEARQRPVPVAKTGKKIVVIDDTELLLIFVDEILSARNSELQISTAHTGTEGCRRAELAAPDLILLDYSLPDINGDEVCRRLLENEKTALIPIVMMSGHVPEMTATAQRYANVVATIGKPFLSHELVALVEKTLADGPRAVLEVPPEKEAPPPPPVLVKHKGNGKAKRVPPAAAATAPPAAAEMTQSEPAAIAETAPMQFSAPATAVAFEPEPEMEPMQPRLRILHKLAVVLPPPLPPAPVEPPISAPVVEPAPPEIAAAPAPQLVIPPTPAEPATIQPLHPAIATPPRLAITLPAPKTVLVGLSLRTDAVQLTASFHIGRIRARPTTLTVSLNFPPESSPLPVALQTGFDIESVTVDQERHLDMIRLIPTRRALALMPQTESSLIVGGVQIGAASEAVELTSSPSSEMTLQLLAAFQIAAVELSPTFEVARLVLKSISRRVRVTLDGPSSAGSGAIFEAAEVQADDAGRLVEIELAPL